MLAATKIQTGIFVKKWLEGHPQTKHQEDENDQQQKPDDVSQLKNLSPTHDQCKDSHQQDDGDGHQIKAMLAIFKRHIINIHAPKCCEQWAWQK